MNFFAKKFAGFKKTLYLCTRKSEIDRYHMNGKSTKKCRNASVAQLVRAPDC